MQSIWTHMLAGWDFVGEPFNGSRDVWSAGCGRPMYPRLAWEPTIVGDFVDPEGVDFHDLKALAEDWLETGPVPCMNGDLTFNKRVSFEDFAVLAQWWRQGTRSIIYETRLDTAPAWTSEGQWQFGIPAGNGGSEQATPIRRAATRAPTFTASISMAITESRWMGRTISLPDPSTAAVTRM